MARSGEPVGRCAARTGTSPLISRAPLGTIARSYLWRDAAAALRRAIVSGELRQGERVSEAQLALEFGVSRMPVRDAIRVLVQEGLLSQEGTSTTVVGCSQAELGRLYDFRLVLERYALRLAIGRVAAAAEAELRAAVEAMRDAAAAPDPAAFGAADLAFHRALVAAAEDRWLLAAWERLAPTIEAAVAVADRHDGDWPKLAASHAALLAMVLRGDEDAAAADLERQLRGGGDQLAEAIARRHPSRPAHPAHPAHPAAAEEPGARSAVAAPPARRRPAAPGTTPSSHGRH